jgi:hypothetical protein
LGGRRDLAANSEIGEEGLNLGGTKIAPCSITVVLGQSGLAGTGVSRSDLRVRMRLTFITRIITSYDDANAQSAPPGRGYPRLVS